MTVRELIKQLQKENPNRLVVCQRDSEGNGYSPLEEYWTGAYLAENRTSGEAGLDKLTDLYRSAGYTEEDVFEDGIPALFLVPLQ